MENSHSIRREPWHVVAEICSVRRAAESNAEVIIELERGATLTVDANASLPDGSTSSGMAAERVRSSSHFPSPLRGPLLCPQMREQTQGLIWLRLVEPERGGGVFALVTCTSQRAGWCLASECCIGDAAALGGVRSWLIDSVPIPSSAQKWRYVVVCCDGAFVREGLELTSTHLYTLVKNCVFQVHERRVNEQGLARLRTDDGWISEDLNPLSGQRGPIATLLPLAGPVAYRVVFPDGAVVRSTVELSSAIVHHMRCGQVVRVDEKQFSDHPAQHCVPRLRLSHPCSGWISQRLNREPPHDRLVVDFVGVVNADPDRRAIASSDPSSSVVRRSSKVPGDRDDLDGDDQTEGQKGGKKSRRLTDAINGETRCVVCLSSARNATFVHGETGHIACCLNCARALKARGDTCPVCRMHIDIVIQHFWA